MAINIMTQEEEFANSMANLLKNQALNDPNFNNLSVDEQLRKMASDMVTPVGTQAALAELITRDDRMNAIKDMIIELVHEQDPVLICGPSGTGKELLAKALHGDRSGPFIALNCAGIPETLVESELFGHKKGAFTDAKDEAKGVFREAENGTIFLDEIGEMNMKIQAKLLRAIQENEVRPVGSTATFKISCRFVAATNLDLEVQMSKNLFRHDLYARLMTFRVNTIPIMDRPGDIPLILEKSGYEGVTLDQIPVEFHPYIAKFNVRALQTYVRRMKVLGSCL